MTCNLLHNAPSVDKGSFRRMRKTDANYALRTNVSSEWRNSHGLEKFPTAANYASEPG